LTIGRRHGEFPGVLKDRTFKIVMVSPGHATGFSISAEPEKTVKYSGKEAVIKL
jgi:alpha-D-xyloside xylohydrolase